MAWNPSPEVQDCRDIAKRRGYAQVIVIGIKPDDGTFAITSYGETRRLCDAAGKIAGQIHKMIARGIIAPDL